MIKGSILLSTPIVVFDRSPVTVNRLCNALKSYSWAGLLKAIENKTIDVDTAFAEFNYIINYFVKAFVPQHTLLYASNLKTQLLLLLQSSITYVNVILR